MGALLLKIIIEQLNQYILSVEQPVSLVDSNAPATLGNIASASFAGGDNSDLSNKVVLSLVNIAEESSLKNNANFLQKDQQHFQLAPIVHVNLYLLFTANFENYNIAVNHLFRVMEFFQGRKVFQFKNAPVTTASPDDINSLGDTEVTVELHTLSFEQLNDLWGSLGGKQMPFVLYRARLVPVQMQQISGREGLITEIDVSTLNSNTH